MNRLRPRLPVFVRIAASDKRSHRACAVEKVEANHSRTAADIVCTIVSAATLAAFLGCQTPSAPFDPFLAGRTTIAPPATAMPAGAAPYYNGGPPTVTIPGTSETIYSPPGAVPTAAPASAVPNAGSGHLPRGISVPQSNNQTAGNGAQLVAAAPADLSSGRTSAVTAAGVTPGPGFRQVNVAEADDGHRDRAATGITSGVVPASYTEPSHEPTIRILEPAEKQKVSGAEAGPPNRKLPAGSQSELSLASALRTDEKQSQRSLPELTDFPAAAETASRELPGYGYEPSYSWLKGKLEYSPSQRRWKLRYIAVEGPNDNFGGSVVLSESEKLKGFEPGDFVLVQGHLLQASEKAKGFSPAYGIDRIKKQ